MQEDKNNIVKLNNEQLRLLQLNELAMLIEVDRICRKNNIKYTLAGGTMLGAVRHKGFIPWDDDIDVRFKREEYEKFYEACKKDLDNEHFFLQEYRTDPNYRWGYSKMRLKGSEFIRIGQEHMHYVTGVNIDIFITDNIPDNAIQRRIQIIKSYCLRKIMYSEVEKLCNAYKEYIDSLCVKYNIKRLLAGTVPIAEALQPQKKELVNPLMEYGYCPAATTPTYTWVCDINGDEEELIKKCEQTTRQALRKLEQSNKYEIIEADNNPEDYDDYVRLHIETYTRTGLADEILSDEYQRNIFNNMIPQGICRVFFLKEKEINENIASVAILVYKNTAYYWWGSSVGEKEVGINKYLLWKSMMIVKDTYYRNGGMEDNFWFETGGAYVYERKGKRKGLNDFKKSFGCQLHPIYRGEYMLP